MKDLNKEIPEQESLFEKMFTSLRMEGEELELRDNGHTWVVKLTRNRGEDTHMTWAKTPWKAVVNMMERLTQ